KQNTNTIIVIGTDGSCNSAHKLSQLSIQTIGVPGTIDNNITFTDVTIGFDTAVSIVLDVINKLQDTMCSHKCSSVVEVMGRHCGDIALYAGLASGVEAILVPKVPYGLYAICKCMEHNIAIGKLHSILVVAEGVGNSHDIAKEIAVHYNIDPHVTIL
ncbi:hypothetical protein K7432_018550, partial [Basidiobolus ranarum]